MGRMDQAQEKIAGKSQTRRLIALGAAIALVLIALVVQAKISADRESAERVDGYYCTLSGVTPMDRAPETGRLCAEILGD